MTALRRAITIPLVVAIEILLLLTGPVLLPAAAVTSLAARSSRPLRTVALILAYAAIELVTLRRIRRGRVDWDRLLADVLRAVYRALRLILDVRVELEAGSVPRDRLTNPLVVLARHCGPGDSLFIAWLLVVHYRLRPRIVLKRLLRVEPLVDLAGDHLPLCFVGGRRRSRERISRLAATMPAGDAFLLFPEGGNFSRPRWRRAIIRLVATGHRRTARLWRRRTHTLPPHHGGTIAALGAAPTADVLLLVHNGFSADGRDRPWWRLPVHHTLLIRTALVPAAEVPRDPAAVTEWLDTTWSDVDSWIADRVVQSDRNSDG
jgi:1-acyl-sn-glycerol-3-phosphate acyltransferase